MDKEEDKSPSIPSLKSPAPSLEKDNFELGEASWSPIFVFVKKEKKEVKELKL